MAKNKVIAYVCWLVGGWFGLHHFYLKRDRHAFVWWSTLGCYGVGWLRDAVRIPDYVNAANEEREYMTELRYHKRRHSTPPFHFTRFIGEVICGTLFGFVLRHSIPEELLNDKTSYARYIDLFVPLATAIGVHLVANVGHEECSLKSASIGAYVWLLWFWQEPTKFIHGAFFSAFGVNWKGKKWRARESSHTPVCKRLLVLGSAALLYSSLWASVLYHNTHITTSDGEKVKLKDAIDNMFKSEAWQEFKRNSWRLWEFYKEHGWEKFKEEMLISLDPEGETSSYKVLGLPSNSTDKEVSKRYRELVKMHHPDKVKVTTEEEKEEVQNKFIEIQKAYETLSNIKQRRAKRSKEAGSTTEDDD